MNHIKKLQAENQALKDTITAIENYLYLPKFKWPENQVNVNDIFLRLDEKKQNMLEKGLTPWDDWAE